MPTSNGVVFSMTTTTGAARNGPVCPVCVVPYIGVHKCSPTDLLARAEFLRDLALKRFEEMNPQPTIGPEEFDDARLDDALCDALMAARLGKYDGLTVEKHLERLIERVRSAEGA